MNSTSESDARCASCGKPLAAGAAFCRACGTRTEPPAAAETAETQVIRPAAPAPPQPAPPQPPPPAQPPPQPPPPPPPAQAPPQAQLPPQAQPPRGSRGWVKPVLIAAVVGLLVGGGVAVAIVTLGGDDSEQAGAPAPGGTNTVPGSEASSRNSGEASSGSAAPGTPGEFPSEDRAAMASEIQATLLAFHEDVVGGRFRDAWSLQSARKRDQYLEERGYGQWKRNQATLSPYLSPGGLTVRIDGLEGEGVARVLLTGMGWSKPGASCGEWSGLTWVKYERGAWAYDPGYSTTPERERVWKPRYDELLGADC